MSAIDTVLNVLRDTKEGEDVFFKNLEVWQREVLTSLYIVNDFNSNNFYFYLFFHCIILIPDPDLP